MEPLGPSFAMAIYTLPPDLDIPPTFQDPPSGGVVVTRGQLPEEVVRTHNLATIGPLRTEALPKGCQVAQMPDGGVLYELVSHEVGAHWAMALLDSASLFTRGLSPLEQALYLVIEGKMEVHHGRNPVLVLEPGEMVSVRADGDPFGCAPQGACVRLLAFDFLHSQGGLPELDPLSCPPSYSCEAFTSYHIISKEVTDKRWNISLVDIRGEISSHYHKLETQIVIVVSGTLEVTADNQQHVLKMGETMRVDPPTIHSLRPAHGEVVRAVFINFPAHDRADSYDVTAPPLPPDLDIPPTPHDVISSGLIIDRSCLPEEVVRRYNSNSVGPLCEEDLPKGRLVATLSGGGTLYEFISHEVGRDWAMALVDTESPLAREAPDPNSQNLYVVVEGDMEVYHGNDSTFVLAPGQLLTHKDEHTLLCTPYRYVRFLMLDILALEGHAELLDGQNSLSELSPALYTTSYSCEAFTTYHIVSTVATDKRWNLSLVDIRGEISAHYHKVETQRVIVVSGTLDITVDTHHHILKRGETIRLNPLAVHSMRPASGGVVRTVWLNFPGHDKADSYEVG